MDIALSDTQTRFYALDLSGKDAASFSVDDGFNIKKMHIQDVAESGALRYMVSTYDFGSGVIRDTDAGEGRKVEIGRAHV